MIGAIGIAPSRERRSGMLPDQAAELVEEVRAVVGAGGGLRMILDAEDGQPLVAEPLERLVVQVDVARLDVRRQRRRVDGEPVILRGDLDLARPLVPNRVVGAAMAELELEGPGP